MRIVVRIGGSVVANPINTQLLAKYAEIIVLLRQQGHEVVVVVGGGALARQFIGFAKELELDMNAQDEVAISCSRLFAQLFLKKLGGYAANNVSVTLEETAECLSRGKVVVMGGLKPGITTDTVATLVAEKITADMLLKGSDQTGVYNKDPRKHPDAVKLDHLTFEELAEVFEQNEHKAGIHQIIDPEAVKILKSKRIKTVVVNGFEPQNMLAAVRGENVGTIIN
ncbi:MAG: UMP kinase [Nitrososphaerota archaeon]|jgi:uridylate kinase|uniref:UMP kinase n=1 Tax=Candidatus Bathycorpusculum sp. TaxID=2994959 RepID=UPI00281F000E|nr:UMP kinase [Candidatus Termitimicrobium sp.]MCL2432322.1 UMP kinase [Candidatus Termitimicrobium sp.]MDR0493195.1 UMP kinase [Nitrososphaerota archaeon]